MSKKVITEELLKRGIITNFEKTELNRKYSKADAVRSLY